MTIRTVDEAWAAGTRDAQNAPPLTQQQATTVALLLAPCLQQARPRAA